MDGMNDWIDRQWARAAEAEEGRRRIQLCGADQAGRAEDEAWWKKDELAGAETANAVRGLLLASRTSQQRSRWLLDRAWKMEDEVVGEELDSVDLDGDDEEANSFLSKDWKANERR
jgi:hypothetical protein